MDKSFQTLVDEDERRAERMWSVVMLRLIVLKKKAALNRSDTNRFLTNHDQGIAMSDLL